MMQGVIFGGKVYYGQVAGILMMDSTIPRIPGDPGHAETFPFPVRYGVIRDFPFEDLVNIDHLRAGVLDAANSLLDSGEQLGAVVLECTNLVSFRSDIQEKLGLPVFDAVSLIEFFSEGYRLRHFKSRYMT
jgi:hypothetical protein